MSSSNTREISLGDGFGEVAVKANGIRIELHADGSVDAYTAGAVKVHPAANDTAQSSAALQIGAIESAGEHKGEIYGGIYPADNKPIWFSAAPRLMDYYAAAAWAKEQGGSLPTRRQGDYLTTLKDKLEIGPAKPDGGGAFTELFNRGSSFPAGYVWLTEPDANERDIVWGQRLGDGDQVICFSRYDELPVLCVRR
jgi:hypothetical protein